LSARLLMLRGAQTASIFDWFLNYSSHNNFVMRNENSSGYKFYSLGECQKRCLVDVEKKTRFSAGQAKRNIGLARKTQSDGRTGGETARQTTDVIEVVAIG
jgi:hypothetical protein